MTQTICQEHNCGATTIDNEITCRGCAMMRGDPAFGRCTACKMLIITSELTLISKLCPTCFNYEEGKVPFTGVMVTLEPEEWCLVLGTLYGQVDVDIFMKMRKQIK